MVVSSRDEHALAVSMAIYVGGDIFLGSSWLQVRRLVVMQWRRSARRRNTNVQQPGMELVQYRWPTEHDQPGRNMLHEGIKIQALTFAILAVLERGAR